MRQRSGTDKGCDAEGLEGSKEMERTDCIAFDRRYSNNCRALKNKCSCTKDCKFFRYGTLRDKMMIDFEIKEYEEGHVNEE